MTVIAYDGRYVATDRQATKNGTTVECTKLFVFGKKVIAFSGAPDHGMMMVAWIKSGCNPSDWPKADHQDRADVAIFERDKHVTVYEKQPVPWFAESKIWADGCGRDYALAAMHLGHSAKEGVEIAIKLDAYCGMGVDVIDLWSLDESERDPK